MLPLLISCESGGGKDEGDENSSSGGAVSGDPLAYQQWHIRNTGQLAYAREAADSTTDMNVDHVHNTLNIKGRGITVVVSDDGLDITHPDLSINTGQSKDYLDNDSDPQPRSSSGSHGTSVAGLIAMTDNNGVGGVGIAPRANIAGRNILASNAQTLLSNLAHQMGLNHNGVIASCCQEGIDVFNYSYGASPSSPSNYQQYAGITALFEMTLAANDNRGFVYVKSAGNGFGSISSFFCPDVANLSREVSCEIAAFDPANTSPLHIIVSAVNSEGRLSSYSTTGTSVWVAGLGGEYGWDAFRRALVGSNSAIASYLLRFYKPAMVTTDTVGCGSGYSRSEKPSGLQASVSDFNYPWERYLDNGNEYVFLEAVNGATTGAFTDASSDPHPENPNCDYTNTFNGTSSAAPTVSGVVALMLEASPSLTWRDVKRILAKTSRKIDPTHGAATLTVGAETLDIEGGWQTNAAGFDFSETYGFGLADARAAVLEARNYADVMGTFNSTPYTDGSVSFTDSSTDYSDLMLNNRLPYLEFVSNQNYTVEAVHLQVDLNHDALSKLMLRLVSPSGTESVVYRPFNAFEHTDGTTAMDNAPFSSNAFYDEPGNGTWRLYLHDVSSDGNAASNFSATMTLYGH